MNEHRYIERIRSLDLVARTGRVTRILPTYIEADGPAAPRGALCEIELSTRRGGEARNTAIAEVVSINRNSIVLAPFEADVPTFSGARVTALTEADGVPVGDAFLGRVVDGLGRPVDGKPAVWKAEFTALNGATISPLERTSPKIVLETGIRAIDGLLTLGRGQRIGVFAASGVGKTSLVTQLARQVDADRCVVCLVGERGREAEALWSEGLSAETRARTTMVVATSDQAAAMRVRAGAYALAMSEHWRAQGLHVLLLLDSVTRLAMAMREIGLAAGEPPTLRAYTPSVFAAIPKLVERCGALKSGGAISAVMTVLSETDDIDDPVSEMMKSLLDGHLILSRRLAEQGHYPAIDTPHSVSRLADGLISDRHRVGAREAIALLSTYESSRTLIEAGVYVRGGDHAIDRSLDTRPALLDFLRQPQDHRIGFAACTEALSQVVGMKT